MAREHTKPSAPQLHVEAGLAAHRKGAFEQASASYQSALALDPANVDALHLLGVLAMQRGAFQPAVGLITQALRHRPEFTDAWINLAGVMRGMQCRDQAIACYDKALSLRPNAHDAAEGKGVVLFELGQFEDALAQLDLSIRLKAKNPAAFAQRANVLLALGRIEEAFDSAQKGVRQGPELALTHAVLGSVLRKQAKADAALAAFDRALKLDPNMAEAHCNRANVLQDVGRHVEALEGYDRAQALNPNLANLALNRGSSLEALGRFAEALACFQRAAEQAPGQAEAHLALGTLQVGLGINQAAEQSFARALEVDPDHEKAAVARGSLRIVTGDGDGAVADLSHAANLNAGQLGLLGRLLYAHMRLAEWSRYEDLKGQIEAHVRAGQAVTGPFEMLGVFDDPELALLATRAWRERAIAPSQPRKARGPRRPGPLRIAFVSADFRNHATAYLLADLLERHDRSKVEVFAIALLPSDDSPIAKRVRAAADHLLDARTIGDDDLAAWIEAHDIDIALDLMGYTNHFRRNLFAQRPARVQLNAVGYPGTLAAEHCDYLFADDVLVGPGEETFYQEAICRLPGIFFTPSRELDVAAIPTRAELGLPEQGFVFSAVGSTWKITPPVFANWMEILRQTPGSVLWLLGGKEKIEANLREAASAAGIAPERLVFTTHVNQDVYLARHHCADLYLDTAPYGAHSTAAGALAQGLPVLTLKGRTFAARVAATILNAAELPDLITHTPEEYIARAVQLAHSPADLAALKARILANIDTCALFDVEACVRRMEKAYQAMSDRYEAGLPPQSFSVQDD